MLTGQFGEIYPPYLDGVGQVMLAYCRYLPRRGHRTLYIAPDNKKYRRDYGCETLLYHSVPLGFLAYHIGFPRLRAADRRRLDEIPFDIVHAHVPFLAGRTARRIARRRGIPLVATFHSKYYDDVYKATHSKALARLAVRYILSFYDSCDEVWAVNESTAQVLRDYGYRGEIAVMPNGTDIILSEDVPPALPEGLSLRPDAPMLLFVGQLSFKKNPHLALRACALLKEKGVPFQFVLAGEGPDHRRLMALTKELGLENEVTFTGRLADRMKLMALYRRADLFVFPSVYDNAPLVVREAAMMGTPALVVEGSCAAEGIAQGDNGFLCRCDEKDIAAAIEKALPRCREVGRRAQETIPLSWETVSEAVEARYAALCEKKKGAAHA
ncbi:MAG: glycosyltransferase [Clostridia bacterium]|nr:glycosyltransferase [Clostridia bacterium]